MAQLNLKYTQTVEKTIEISDTLMEFLENWAYGNFSKDDNHMANDMIHAMWDIVEKVNPNFYDKIGVYDSNNEPLIEY